MKFTEEKIKAINDCYTEDKKLGYLVKRGSEGCELKVENVFNKAGIVKKNVGWHICDVEEIDFMITELERIKACILQET